MSGGSEAQMTLPSIFLVLVDVTDLLIGPEKHSAGLPTQLLIILVVALRVSPSQACHSQLFV